MSINLSNISNNSQIFYYVPIVKLNFEHSTKFQNKFILISIKSQFNQHYPLFRILDESTSSVYSSAHVNDSHQILLDTSKISKKIIISFPDNISVSNLSFKLSISSTNIKPSVNTSDKIALLLIGFDKGWNILSEMWKNIFINMNPDIFIVTYLNCFVDIENIFNKYVKSVCRNNIEKLNGTIDGILNSHKHPPVDGHVKNVLMQYKNLETCFDNVEMYELSSGFEYKYVMKVRADAKLSNFNFNFDDFVKNDVLYMESDYIFYGMRQFMNIVCHLFSAKFSYYDVVPWNKRYPNYRVLLDSILHNPSYIFEFQNWSHKLLKNKLPAIPINVCPSNPTQLNWNSNPRTQMINTCTYFCDNPTNLENIPFTSLTDFDRKPFMFQCEYFIIDWAIHNNISVYEPTFFSVVELVK